MWFNKNVFNARDSVIFIKNVNTVGLFGSEDTICKGTTGIISDINVTNTSYDIKHFKNYEITYGDKQRVILLKDDIEKILSKC